MSGKKNPAHSVFQRLLNHARENREDFNLLLIRYGMERFLYRLSISTYNESFILFSRMDFRADSGNFIGCSIQGDRRTE